MVQSQKFVGAGPRACPNQGDHRGCPYIGTSVETKLTHYLILARIDRRRLEEICKPRLRPGDAEEIVVNAEKKTAGDRRENYRD